MFRQITPGIETLHSSFRLPRHRHLHAYATLVLAGSLEESGYNGRIIATEGDVLVHPALDCHANARVAGVKLIRFDWIDTWESPGLYRVTDPDTIARTAEKDVSAACHLLQCSLKQNAPSSPGIKNDWPDLLAKALITDKSLQVGTWAERNGLSAATVSRGFSAVYGIAPVAFRAELRARAAWLRISRGSDSLSTIAMETGFADQSHMTRWIRRITGGSPNAWRAARCLHPADRYHASFSKKECASVASAS
jgi:AraC-like DNA-binding protein